MATAKKITINPISRLEGHGKVTIHLDENGEVTDARFHVTQFRGFEKFCQGRSFEEMPIITQRVCGICPVSHQLASAKACDAILGVEIPETAKSLRELEHMGQYIQSHALHFFYLASPDLLLGWDADPAIRNVVGVVEKFPEIATQGIYLRKFGQQIIAALGGKRIHPSFAVSGGVSSTLSEEDRDNFLGRFEQAYEACRTGLNFMKDLVEKKPEEMKRFANFSSKYMGLVDTEGRLNLYDGKLRVIDGEKKLLNEFEPSDYLEFIGEKVMPWSYMKFPFYIPAGWPDGYYRVGPLGRINAADGLSTPLAQEEFEQYHKTASSGLRGATLLYHYARLIELLYGLERAEELLMNDNITNTDIRTTTPPVNEEGVGVIEAPRGTLIHHYEVDEYGKIQKVNLIVATGHNNMAMNRSIELVAKEYIKNGEVKEGILNRVEGAIRAYDPCLSCATHAIGQMPLKIQVHDFTGELLIEEQRD